MDIQYTLKEINHQLADAEPAEIIRWTQKKFGDGVVMTSGFGDRSALSLHVVTAIIPDIPVIALDPRFFFAETREFMGTLTKRFNLNLKIYVAELGPEEMAALYPKYWERDKESVRQHYESIRKEIPLQRAFKELHARAWISGVRRYQTANRSQLDVVEYRPGDTGNNKGGIYKIHPFLNMTEEDVIAYFKKHDLPYHPLVTQGYDSIGDELLTKPGKRREGRKALGTAQECGLHCKVTSAEYTESMP